MLNKIRLWLEEKLEQFRAYNRKMARRRRLFDEANSKIQEQIDNLKNEK